MTFELAALLLLGLLATLATLRGRKRPWVRFEHQINLENRLDAERCFPLRATWEPRK